MHTQWLLKGRWSLENAVKICLLDIVFQNNGPFPFKTEISYIHCEWKILKIGHISLGVLYSCREKIVFLGRGTKKGLQMLRF